MQLDLSYTNVISNIRQQNDIDKTVLREMRVWLFLVLVTLYWTPGRVQNMMGNYCANVGCIGTLDTCPDGMILTPNVTLDGCCPGCVAYLEENASCSSTTLTCQPGLECDGGTCVPSDEAESGRCKSYDFRPEQMWQPKCEPDGSYSAVQCKGERLTGRCFCYSENGERIFGQQWWSLSENMTCACSRRVLELEASGRTDVTLHCSEEGNFEILQCDSGMCWCAEPRWGDAIGEVVPESMIDLLPCYNATLVGTQYLRQCDSALHALRVLRKEMTSHGTLGDSFIALKCGLDGTYGEFQLEGANRYCRWKDNTNIFSYMSGNNIPPSDVDCYCARDIIYYDIEGYGFTMQCGGSGSYLTVQHDDQGNPLCIDRDGFQYREPVITGTNVECPKLTWQKSSRLTGEYNATLDVNTGGSISLSLLDTQT